MHITYGARVFYGFILPTDFMGEPEDLHFPEGVCFGSSGRNTESYWIGITASIKQISGGITKLNTQDISSYGLFEGWNELLVEFCAANEITVSVHDVGWYLSSYLFD